jgi:hypothetical protein
LRAKRVDLHARIGRVLDQQFPDTKENNPEVIARHYAEAGLASEAIDYWQRAGNRAAKRSANQEAVAHFRRAKQLIESLPDRGAFAEQELQLLIALGPALMTTRSSATPEIGSIYARASELARLTGRMADLFPTIWGAWLVAFVGGDFQAAKRLLDELFDIANTTKENALMLQAHHAAWPTLWVRSQGIYGHTFRARQTLYWPCIGPTRSIHARSTCACPICTRRISNRSTCAGATLRPNQSSMHTGGFCSQRRQYGRWDHRGLHPTDYSRYTTTEAGHQAFATNRPSGRDRVQKSESKFRHGRRSKSTTKRAADRWKPLISRSRMPGRKRGCLSDGT